MDTSSTRDRLSDGENDSTGRPMVFKDRLKWGPMGQPALAETVESHERPADTHTIEQTEMKDGWYNVKVEGDGRMGRTGCAPGVGCDRKAHRRNITKQSRQEKPHPRSDQH